MQGKDLRQSTSKQLHARLLPRLHQKSDHKEKHVPMLQDEVHEDRQRERTINQSQKQRVRQPKQRTGISGILMIYQITKAFKAKQAMRPSVILTSRTVINFKINLIIHKLNINSPFINTTYQYSILSICHILVNLYLS